MPSPFFKYMQNARERKNMKNKKPNQDEANSAEQLGRQTFSAQHNGRVYRENTPSRNENLAWADSAMPQTFNSVNVGPPSTCPCCPSCPCSGNKLNMQIWEWNMRQKREAMLRLTRSEKSVQYSVSSRDARRRRRTNNRRSRRKQVKRTFRWCPMFRHKKPKPLNDGEKDQLQELYDTPCSSITMNQGQRPSPCPCQVDNWECRTLNLEGEYQCCNGTTRQSSRCTVVFQKDVKCNLKPQVVINETRESSTECCCCPKSSSSEQSSTSNYVTMRVKCAKSEVCPKRETICMCQRKSPKKVSHQPKQYCCYPILCKDPSSEYGAQQQCHYQTLCKPTPTCPALCKSPPKCIVRLPKSLRRCQNVPQEKGIVLCCRPNAPQENEIAICCRPNGPQEKEIAICCRPERKKRKKVCRCCCCCCRCHHCCCCKKSSDCKKEGTSKTYTTKKVGGESTNGTEGGTSKNSSRGPPSKDQSNPKPFSDDRFSQKPPSDNQGPMSNSNHISKENVNSKTGNSSPNTRPLGEFTQKSRLPSPMDPAKTVFNYHPTEFPDTEHEMLLTAVCDAIASARASHSNVHTESSALSSNFAVKYSSPRHPIFGETGTGIRLLSSYSKRLPVNTFGNGVQKKAFLDLDHYDKIASAYPTLLNQESEKTPTCDSRISSGRASSSFSDLLHPRAWLASTKFPKVSLSTLCSNLKPSFQKKAKRDATRDAKITKINEESLSTLERSSKIPIPVSDRSTPRANDPISTNLAKIESLVQSNPTHEECTTSKRLPNCTSISQMSSYSSSLPLEKFMSETGISSNFTFDNFLAQSTSPLKMRYNEVRLAEKDKLEGPLSKKVKTLDSSFLNVRSQSKHDLRRLLFRPKRKILCN